MDAIFLIAQGLWYLLLASLLFSSMLLVWAFWMHWRVTREERKIMERFVSIVEDEANAK